MLTDSELSEIRRLALAISKRKEENYDSITWERAIKEALSEYTIHSDDYFRKMALLEFFIAEDRQIVSLDTFLEGLDESIRELRDRSNNYVITDDERFDVNRKVDRRLAAIGVPTNKKSAYEVHQLLIDKVFHCQNLTELCVLLNRLGKVLKAYYSDGYLETQIIAECCLKLKTILAATSAPATKKQVAAASDLAVDKVGLLLYRFSQIGISSVTKKGRENVYAFNGNDFDNNIIRREWEWLWAVPHKKLSLRLYEQR